MELVYVTVVGLGIGVLVRYLLPGRQMHGIALVPAIAAMATAVLWAGLTWLGFRADAGWIWVITLVGTTAVALIADVVISRVRTAEDARHRHALTAGRA